jgi:Predicted DNA alkylation repair enzyme
METILLSKEIYDEFIDYLKSCGDEEYKIFNEKIVPGIEKSYGVRAPLLKDIGKKLSKNKNIGEIVALLHNGLSYEEKLLEGYLFPYINYNSINEMENAIDNYVIRIDNWALCDSFVVSLRRLVTKNKDFFFNKALKCAKSQNPWEIRFGLILLNGYFKDAVYVDSALEVVENIKNDHYYVRMGKAWLVSTLYLSDSEKIILFLKHSRIDTWSINKSIQKIIESRRVSESEKEFIRTLKRK